VVRSVGWFDTLFGSGTPFPCDDLEYATRCSHAGFTGHHVPDLVVRHHHGRKPGSLKMVQRMNEYHHAIGACNMRALLQGRWEARKQFAAQWRQSRTHALHALSGALHYLGRRAVAGSRR
jgi:hypothetical protein